MTIGIPGQYKWLRYHPVYHREQVAMILPIAFDGMPWGVSPVQSTANCIQGDGSCSHKCAKDQWDEECLYDGDHRECFHQHNGHDRCGYCVCINPVVIRGSDEGRESDAQATRIDLEIAWNRTRMSNEIREALELRHRHGFSQGEIGTRQGVTQQAVSKRLDEGHKKIADYLNGVCR